MPASADTARTMSTEVDPRLNQLGWVQRAAFKLEIGQGLSITRPCSSQSLQGVEKSELLSGTRASDERLGGASPVISLEDVQQPDDPTLWRKMRRKILVSHI
jgi:hypothetical protein